jgi:uncharacterized protein YejL (UPF0352 family)
MRVHFSLLSAYQLARSQCCDSSVDPDVVLEWKSAARVCDMVVSGISAGNLCIDSIADASHTSIGSAAYRALLSSLDFAATHSKVGDLRPLQQSIRLKATEQSVSAVGRDVERLTKIIEKAQRVVASAAARYNFKFTKR